MALLENQTTQARSVLLARHLVGRSQLAHLRLNEPNVSAEHAVLSWNGQQWELNDLGSRNGTTLDGRRLEPGERARVARGAIVCFGGSSNRWRLIDDGPPVPMARPLDGSEPLCAEHELIALPGPEAPEVTVFRDGAGEWMIEREGGTERAMDGRTVSAGGKSYTLHLPDVVAPTWEDEEPAPSVEQLRLRFTVSRDEEFVEVTALAARRAIELGARAHHGVLLALARARRQDEQEAAKAPAASRLPETSLGWLYIDELARSLRLDEPHLNVAVYRCRQQLASAGVVGAAGIIERRKPTRQLRLGVARFEIVSV